MSLSVMSALTRPVRRFSAWRALSLRLLPAVFGGLMLLSATPASVAAPRASAVASAASLKLVGQVEGIEEYRLPNGLQVLLIADDSKPTTTVNMTYRVGSRHESYGETGMAHLLEHLIFKGSPKHPQVWAEFNKRGLSANGTTWFDRTNYYASFAANPDNLRWYLAWQADAMVNSFIARKDLDSEMTVVRNEMERGENSPGRVLLEKTQAAMFQWHNYGKSTIGARADVENVDIARLQAFYRRYYQPDNATLIVSGQFDPAQVRQWIAQFYGPIPKPKRVLPPQYTLDPVQDGERTVTVRRVGGVPLLYAGYHVMPGAHADYAAVELLTLILGDTPSGRLHKALVEPGLASGAFAFSEGMADPGYVMFGAQLDASQDMGQAREAMLQTIESLAAQPVTQAELDRARAKWLKGWEMGFADPEEVGVALSEAVALGDWRLFFLLRDRVKAATLADVQRVAQQYLLASNRTLGQYIPTTQPARAPIPQRVDVAQALADFKPAASQGKVEAFDVSPANIDARTQRYSLPVGLQVALLPKGTRGEAVRATLNLRFGTAESLAGWGATPAALVSLLDKGTATLDRQQWEDRLDALQADVGFSARPGVISVQMTTRREHLPAVIALVAQALQQPALPPAALEEVRRQALTAIEARRKEPEALLSQAIRRHGNPYPRGDVRHAPTFDETAEDWRAVDLARVRAFHQRFLSAQHAQLAIVGAMDEAATRQAIEMAFGQWRGTGTEPYARVPDPLVPVPAARMQIDTPDKQNAVFSIKLPLPISDRDPDYPALMLANHLLGSGGDSRLWNRIRERDGLSYSVYSAVQWNPIERHSTWVANAIYAPQNRARVEAAFLEEVQRALSQGFTQAELEAGRVGLLSFRRLSRAQDETLSWAWASNLYLGRTFAESAKVDAALEKLTLDEVNAALRRYIVPAQFVSGVAGDFTPSKP